MSAESTVETTAVRAGARFKLISRQDTAAFTIEQVGGDVFIDDEGVIRFDRANGRYAAPGSADALVAVTALGVSTQVGAIAIDGQIWITNPLTGRWEDGPEALTFNPAQIFDRTVGLSGLLGDGFLDAELASIDPDADGRHQVSGVVDPQRVSDLTGGLIDDVSNATVWVDAETGRVAEGRCRTGRAGESTNDVGRGLRRVRRCRRLDGRGHDASADDG
jgi:hypothetical protein